MKKLYILLFTLFIASTATYAATKTVKHTIKNGETLYTIAHKNHTTIEEVRKANGLKKGDMLKLGKVLKVPQNTYFPDKKMKSSKSDDKKIVKKIGTKKSKRFSKYSIKKGETLQSIARRNHTTIEEVRKANGLKNGETLKLGRVLKIPQNSYLSDKKKKVLKVVTKKVEKKKVAKVVKKVNIKKTAKVAKYTIKSGDTLFTIARKHHTTIAEVKKANGLKKAETLKLGRVLKVPKNTYLPSKKKKVVKVATKKVKKKRIAKVEKKKLKLATIPKKKKLKIKKVKSSRILRTAINTHSKPLPSKRIKKRLQKKYTMDDIFFKASQPNIRFSNFNSKTRKIATLAKKKLGKRYVWGATGQRNTFDCSGFTNYVYKKNGINIPRTSINQSKFGKFVSRSNLKKGDLVFFDTSKRRKGYVNHVGIYLGNGKFIHASSAKKKVVITSLSKKFYSQRYKGARRPS